MIKKRSCFREFMNRSFFRVTPLKQPLFLDLLYSELFDLKRHTKLCIGKTVSNFTIDPDNVIKVI
jgi:hypothetical protein